MKIEKTVNSAIKYFCIVIIAMMVGYAWRMHHELINTKAHFTPAELETVLKHELNNASPAVFRITGSNIELTKRADGSAILRIKEGK